MPTPITLPFAPLMILDFDALVTWGGLEPWIRDRLEAGVSLCITLSGGEPNQGGYFFHFRKTVEGFEFSTFDRQGVLTFGTDLDCVALMNHVSGRQYNEDMWRQCQFVNLRTDEEG